MEQMCVQGAMLHDVSNIISYAVLWEWMEQMCVKGAMLHNVSNNIPYAVLWGWMEQMCVKGSMLHNMMQKHALLLPLLRPMMQACAFSSAQGPTKVQDGKPTIRGSDQVTRICTKNSSVSVSHVCIGIHFGSGHPAAVFQRQLCTHVHLIMHQNPFDHAPAVRKKSLCDAPRIPLIMHQKPLRPCTSWGQHETEGTPRQICIASLGVARQFLWVSLENACVELLGESDPLLHPKGRTHSEACKNRLEVQNTLESSMQK